jgi:hypothetical protein
MNINYGLLAISGDCSARGMSDKADFIRLSNKHLNLVKKYLRNQLELQLYSMSDDTDEELRKLVLQTLVDEHHDLGNKVIDVGVFEHKWHKRTNWVLEEIDD